MLSLDPIDPNRFHTKDTPLTIGFQAINTANLPDLIVNSVPQTLTNVTAGNLSLRAATFGLNTGNNVLAIALTFSGGPPGAPPGTYDVYEVVSAGGANFALFLKSRSETEPANFSLIVEKT